MILGGGRLATGDEPQNHFGNFTKQPEEIRTLVRDRASEKAYDVQAWWKIKSGREVSLKPPSGRWQ